MDFDPSVEEQSLLVENKYHEYPEHNIRTFEKHDVYTVVKDGEPIFGGVVAMGIIPNSPCCGETHDACHVEDLLVIAADRLAYLNQGEWHCPENDSAIANINAALLDLSKRTYRRKQETVSQPGA